jgi:FixJ family two-component response regulator
VRIGDDDSLWPALERLLNATDWRVVTYASAKDAAVEGAACESCAMRLSAF